ncbi:MAG: biotin--[Clostridia bacterium]|nr:biotin--[acetyl-CoA-carboxylase] ligase [Clostridia bacterium]
MLKKSNEQLKANIEKNLKGNYDIHIFDEIKSTNTTLKEMAEAGAKEGTIIIAHKQTEGRGTQGRKFHSPLNGLYISLLVRPNVDIQKSLYITVATAVAVVNAIRKVLGIKCGIKWVNDIIYRNKKVGGILTEGEIESSSNSLKYAVVGIGLNLSKPKGGFSKDIVDIATTLLERDISETEYCKIVAEMVNIAFKLYRNLNKKTFIKKYQTYSVLKKKEIKYAKNGEIHIGKVLRIDNNAKLIVKENKEKIKLCAGEVSLIK